MKRPIRVAYIRAAEPNELAVTQPVKQSPRQLVVGSGHISGESRHRWTVKFDGVTVMFSAKDYPTPKAAVRAGVAFLLKVGWGTR